jgi:penicillin-binding protein 2
VLGYVAEYNAGEVQTLRSWGRLVAGGADLLARVRDGEDPRVSSAFGRAFGRAAQTVQTPEELYELLDGLDEEHRESLGLVGPLYGELDAWRRRCLLVELTEGEQVWTRARGHLHDRRVGRMGVERVYNQALRGTHGYRVVIRNLVLEGGTPVPELDYLRAERPRPGGDLPLEIDIRLQRAADEALARTGLPGAVVVLEPSTGAVRVLVSRPTFDPNAFVSGEAAEVRRILEDPARPLVARATSGIYAPGSVFKVVVALAGLEERVLGVDTLFDCHHIYEVDGRAFRCLADPGHGSIDLPVALTASCNIYFYKAIERIGPEAVLRWARALGFGAPTGIDLPAEAAGTIPDPDAAGGFSARRVAQIAIGQGPIAATPLQVAQLFAAVANDGPAYTPRVVSAPRIVSSARRISPDVRRTLVRGLVGTVHDVRGTAHEAFFSPRAGSGRAFVEEFPGLQIASKTGTAERAGGAPHSWFAGFAPADAPQVAFAVVVEGGGHGGAIAAPVAADVLAAFFTRYGWRGREPPPVDDDGER